MWLEGLPLLQANALKGHEPEALSGFEESMGMTSTAMSDVVPLEFHEFIEMSKTKAQPIETDLRDARRRINAAKPKVKKVTQTKGEDDSDESA